MPLTTFPTIFPQNLQQVSNLKLFNMQMALTRQLHAIHSPIHLYLNTFGNCTRDHP